MDRGFNQVPSAAGYRFHGIEEMVDMSSVCPQVKNAMFEYGRHLGLAFQVVDDILDFTTHADLLGKPQVSFGVVLSSILIRARQGVLDHFCGSRSYLRSEVAA